MQNSCLKNFVKLWRNICDFALGILEFSSLRGEAKQSLGILKFPASLRGSKAEGAISSNRRHCEALKKPKQSLGILEFCSLLG